jgi:hypothetical protein
VLRIGVGCKPHQVPSNSERTAKQLRPEHQLIYKPQAIRRLGLSALPTSKETATLSRLTAPETDATDAIRDWAAVLDSGQIHLSDRTGTPDPFRKIEARGTLAGSIPVVIWDHVDTEPSGS